jgi:hypothetical protein
VCVPGIEKTSKIRRAALKMTLSLRRKGSSSVVTMIESLSRIWSMFFKMS